jgi:dTDP-4-dehydrorhamnose 3,5-epimerase-like enzyme
MRFTPLALDGVVLVAMTPHREERGFCKAWFVKAKRPKRWPQMHISVNAKAGTLRGIHCRHAPFDEPEVVRCNSGQRLTACRRWLPFE